MMTHYEEDIHVTGGPNEPDFKTVIVLFMIAVIVLLIYKQLS